MESCDINMRKESALLVFVSLLLVITNVDSGLLATRYQIDNRPDCIWIWYPKIYPRPRRTTTVVPTTIPSAAATEASETTPAPENGAEALADAGGEATESATSDVEEVTVAEDGGAN